MGATRLPAELKTVQSTNPVRLGIYFVPSLCLGRSGTARASNEAALAFEGRDSCREAVTSPKGGAIIVDCYFLFFLA